MNCNSLIKSTPGHSQSICVLLVCLIGFGLVLSSENSAVASDTGQYKQMLDQGQFQPLLTQLNVAIAKQSSKTDATDRYSLLMLKGEALLHLKSTGAAQDAFNAAAQVGADDKSTSIAKATVDLIKHSGVSKYQPRTKTGDAKTLPAAIDIIDPTSRKDAFNAYLTDQLETLKPKVEKADSITSLSSITALAKQVNDARNVEIAGTDTDAKTKDLLEKLASRGGALLSDVLKPLDGQIQAVTKDAEKHQKAMGRRSAANSFSSLTPPDADELDSIASQAQQVATAAAQMVPIFGSVGDFKTIQSDAEKVVESVNKLLKQYKHPAAS